MQEKITKQKNIMLRDLTAFGKDEFSKTLPEALNENMISSMSGNEQLKFF